MDYSSLTNSEIYNNYTLLGSILNNSNFDPNTIVVKNVEGSFTSYPAWVWVLINSSDMNVINFVLDNKKINFYRMDIDLVLDILDTALTKDQSIFNRIGIPLNLYGDSIRELNNGQNLHNINYMDIWNHYPKYPNSTGNNIKYYIKGTMENFILYASRDNKEVALYHKI